MYYIQVCKCINRNKRQQLVSITLFYVTDYRNAVIVRGCNFILVGTSRRFQVLCCDNLSFKIMIHIVVEYIFTYMRGHDIIVLTNNKHTF